MSLPLLLAFVICSINLIYSRTSDTFTIGVLFNEEDFDQNVAMAAAINRNNLFQRTKFKALSENVPPTDTFTTSKILCDMTQVDDGLVAIFGPESPTSASMVQSICGYMEIPHIQINWKPTPSYSHTIVNFFPDADLLAIGLRTVVEHLGWRSYTILYETNDGLIRLQEVLKIPTPDNILIRQLGPGDDHRALLKEIKNFTNNPIILDCDTDHIIPILHQAKQVQLLDYYHNFLLTSLDAHTLDFGPLETLANITTIRLTDPNSRNLHNAVSDWQITDQRITTTTEKVRAETALMHDAVTFFTSVFQELRQTDYIEARPLSCDNDDKFELGYRLASYLLVRTMDESLTGPIRFDKYGRRIDFRLEVVEIVGDRAEKVAEWKPEFYNNLNVTRTQSQQMQQFVESLQKLKVVNVTSRIGPPYLNNRVPRDGEILEGNNRYEGYSMDLIAAIAKELNFTFRFELAEDGKYGNYDPKIKGWNGMIRDLLDRKAQLGICDLTITHQRRSVVDFSLPFMTLGVSILYTKSVKEDANKFAFMDPLDFEVWVYTVTLYLVVSITLYVITRMAPGDWENPHPCNPDPEELENIWDLKNCFWITLGSIMTQGCDILPKGISSRMGASMWWFFSLIMTSSYTANLAAFLTKNLMGATINSAEELAKQTKVKYGTVEGGATQSFFRDSNFSTYQRMWMQMVQSRPSVFEKSNADGVKRVNNTKNRLYAFLMESSSIEYEKEKNCNFRQVGGRLDSKGYGIAMPMNSPYRSAIDQTLLKFQESGKLGELKTRWWKDKVEKEVPCDEDDGASDTTSAELALANVGGVFIVLGIGIGIAFLLAFIEFLWNVQKVAVEEHITYREALWVELKFAFNVWVTKKRVKPLLSESSSSDGSETRSVAQKMMKGAGSFLNLEVFDKISMKRD